MNVNNFFKKNGYVFVKNVVSEDVCNFAVKYYKNKLNKHISDNINNFDCLGRYKFKKSTQTKGSSWELYKSSFGQTLLNDLLPIVENETGLNLYPTYSFFRMYQKDSMLLSHKDRKSCEYSVTLNLGNIGGKKWPIYIENLDGEENNYDLNPGDIIIYRGTILNHWRNENPNEEYYQLFLHYVNQNGNFRNLINDRLKYTKPKRI